MNKEYEQLSIEFTTKAQKLFIFTFEQLRDSTKKLNRQRDENVFQLQVGKFISTLKLQLVQIAHELLRKNETIKNTNEANLILRDKINLYIVEFKQKAKLL